MSKKDLQDQVEEVKQARTIKWTSWHPDNCTRLEEESKRLGLPFSRAIEFICMQYLGKKE